MASGTVSTLDVNTDDDEFLGGETGGLRNIDDHGEIYDWLRSILEEEEEMNTIGESNELNSTGGLPNTNDHGEIYDWLRNTLEEEVEEEMNTIGESNELIFTGGLPNIDDHREIYDWLRNILEEEEEINTIGESNELIFTGGLPNIDDHGEIYDWLWNILNEEEVNTIGESNELIFTNIDDFRDIYNCLLNILEEEVVNTVGESNELISMREVSILEEEEVVNTVGESNELIPMGEVSQLHDDSMILDDDLEKLIPMVSDFDEESVVGANEKVDSMVRDFDEVSDVGTKGEDYCYVCELPAPSSHWGKGSSALNHCHEWKRINQAAQIQYPNPPGQIYYQAPLLANHDICGASRHTNLGQVYGLDQSVAFENQHDLQKDYKSSIQNRMHQIVHASSRFKKTNKVVSIAPTYLSMERNFYDPSRWLLRSDFPFVRDLSTTSRPSLPDSYTMHRFVKQMSSSQQACELEMVHSQQNNIASTEFITDRVVESQISNTPDNHDMKQHENCLKILCSHFGIE